jgi:hypothetical protein
MSRDYTHPRYWNRQLVRDYALIAHLISPAEYLADPKAFAGLRQLVADAKRDDVIKKL